MARTLAVATALLTALTIGLSAKGALVKIRISGASLALPVEITDTVSLKTFNVWGWPTPQHEEFVIQYANTSLPEPPRTWRRYHVSFVANRPTPTEIYTVVYEFDPSVPQGYVYIPRTELNSRTISRQGMEEWWFRASTAWEQAVRPMIARAEATPNAAKR